MSALLTRLEALGGPMTFDIGPNLPVTGKHYSKTRIYTT